MNIIKDMINSADKDNIYLAATIIRDSNTLDKRLLKDISLFDRIKDYSDVYKELNEEEKQSPFDKIKQIERLFNGSWKKDRNNINQEKWYPYFYIVSGSLVFSVSSCRHHRSSIFSGQVGFYKDEKTSDFIGKTFIKIYEEIM